MSNAPIPRAGIAIDNLRAVVILLVLAFHSCLAYLSFLPAHPFAFDSPPFLWRAFPIVDGERWIGFDLFCAWLDVFLMSFFLLLSGLFTWPSLLRKGARAFLCDRFMRLGLPFAVVVGLLMPAAHYPTYLQSAAEPGLAVYWRHWLALPLWPCGPMWFLAILLVGDAAAAGLFALLAGRRQAVQTLASYARRHPARFLAGLVVASALAYVPMALSFGTSAWFQSGPFSFQLSRPLHYAVYFFAGVAIGAGGIERSLVAPDAGLARGWRRWLVAAVLAFAAWIGLTGAVMNDAGAAPLALRLLADLSFVVACFCSCFLAMAAALRFGHAPSRPALNSLTTNAYGMYLIHYVFVVWLQYALLGVAADAVAKAAIVFAGTLFLSWSATAASRRVPAVAQVIGAGRRAPVAAPRALPTAGPEALAD